jgi:hypothetical protein
MGMAQAVGEEQDRPLELQIIDAQRQSGRQHLDQERRAAGSRGRHEKAVLANWSHFALDPVQGSEGVR